MKSINIYLDDVRDIPEVLNDDSGIPWVLCRNVYSAMYYLMTHDVYAISLDHDLGDHHGYTGADLVKWMIAQFNSNKKLPPRVILSHSANPVGKRNILNYVSDLHSMEDAYFEEQSKYQSRGHETF